MSDVPKNPHLNKPKPKRFIAGAVCPKCAAMDRVMMYERDGKKIRECVACGFSDELRFENQRAELDTRVNKSAEQKRAETQVLQFPPRDDQ